MNAASFSPKSMVILGLVGFGIVSFLAYHWLTARTLSEADLTPFTGRIVQAREYTGKRKFLEIELADQPFVFRSFAAAHEFSPDMRKRLAQGVSASLGVASSEAGAPRHDWSQNQKFFEFVSMKIDGENMLTVDAYNRSVESNRRVGPWFCLVMAIIAIFLIGMGLRGSTSSKAA